VGIPKRNGYDLCKAIRNDPVLAATRVVLTYSSMDVFDEARAERSGAAGSLAKPFLPSQLLSTIGEVMGQGFLDGSRPIDDSMDSDSISNALSSGEDALTSAETRFFSESAEEARPLQSDFITSIDSLGEVPSGLFDDVPSGNIVSIEDEAPAQDPEIAALREAAGHARAGGAAPAVSIDRDQLAVAIQSLVQQYLDEHLDDLVAKKVDEALRDRKP